MLNIVLHEPEIPQNAGNIARTCSIINARLHLIRPLGFSVSDKYLKRAGLDYWQYLDITYYDNLKDFFEKNKDAKCFFATTKAHHTHCDVSYPDECYIFFGKESAGLPEDLLYNNPETSIRIPMKDYTRSLNLSNSVAIIAYEYERQKNFAGLAQEGELTKYKWED